MNHDLASFIRRVLLSQYYNALDLVYMARSRIDGQIEEYFDPITKTPLIFVTRLQPLDCGQDG